MPLVLRGIGLESGILVQKFAVRQGSAPRPTTIILYSFLIILSNQHLPRPTSNY